MVDGQLSTNEWDAAARVTVSWVSTTMRWWRIRPSSTVAGTARRCTLRSSASTPRRARSWRAPKSATARSTSTTRSMSSCNRNPANTPYYHFIANAAGITYEASGTSKNTADYKTAFNPNWVVKTSQAPAAGCWNARFHSASSTASPRPRAAIGGASISAAMPITAPASLPGRSCPVSSCAPMVSAKWSSTTPTARSVSARWAISSVARSIASSR